MRRLLTLMFAFLLAAPIGAQPVATTSAQTGPPMLMPAPWSPISDYVEAGQDEPGYRQWIVSQPWRSAQVRQFHDYLTASGVSYIAPTWQLLRTASDWRKCGAEPFEIPPQEEWANIVNTLRYVRDYVVPAVGPVEPVSVFRNAALNRCAGGAPESVHRSMSAIDFVPLSSIDRDTMIHRLCARHQIEGPRFNAGLGFYARMRFHVDSWKYRTWGVDDSGHLACPKVLPIGGVPVLAKAPDTGSPGAGALRGTATAAIPPSAAIRTAGPPAPGADPLAPLPTSGDVR
ncbi:D-Ala-D-Ala carboxypeptidase family metallohydrolase [Sphingomonas humi]